MMDMKTIYVIDYDILRETKKFLYQDLYGNIPTFFKQRKFISLDVESIPKEKEIILMNINGFLKAMSVYKVVYYEWKIFVIVYSTEVVLRTMEKDGKEEKSKFAATILSSYKEQAM